MKDYESKKLKIIVFALIAIVFCLAMFCSCSYILVKNTGSCPEKFEVSKKQKSGKLYYYFDYTERYYPAFDSSFYYQIKTKSGKFDRGEILKLKPVLFDKFIKIKKCK